MTFFGFVDEICLDSPTIFLDLSKKFGFVKKLFGDLLTRYFGFVNENFWFADKIFGFVDKMFWICRQNWYGNLLMKCFGPEEAWRAKRRPEVPKGGPKGHRLEVGPQRGPRLLVQYISLPVLFLKKTFGWTNEIGVRHINRQAPVSNGREEKHFGWRRPIYPH